MPTSILAELIERIHLHLDLDHMADTSLRAPGGLRYAAGDGEHLGFFEHHWKLLDFFPHETLRD